MSGRKNGQCLFCQLFSNGSLLKKVEKFWFDWKWGTLLSDSTWFAQKDVFNTHVQRRNELLLNSGTQSIWKRFFWMDLRM